MNAILCILALLLAVFFIVYTLKTKNHGKCYVAFCVLSGLLLVTIAFLDKIIS